MRWRPEIGTGREGREYQRRGEEGRGGGKEGERGFFT